MSSIMVSKSPALYFWLLACSSAWSLGADPFSQGLALAGVLDLPPPVLDMAAKVSDTLCQQIERRRRTSQASAIARRRKLILNLKESLTQALDGSLEGRALASWLRKLQAEFVARMAAIDADTGEASEEPESRNTSLNAEAAESRHDEGVTVAATDDSRAEVNAGLAAATSRSGPSRARSSGSRSAIAQEQQQQSRARPHQATVASLPSSSSSFSSSSSSPSPSLLASSNGRANARSSQGGTLPTAHCSSHAISRSRQLPHGQQLRETAAAAEDAGMEDDTGTDDEQAEEDVAMYDDGDDHDNGNDDDDEDEGTAEDAEMREADAEEGNEGGSSSQSVFSELQEI